MTIHAQHPDKDKKGVNISKEKYDIIRAAIRSCLEAMGPAPLQQLIVAISDQLGDTFEGSIGWYVTTVKLDMEARGELICDRSQSPHVHFLATE